jgi:uroporphyrin-III C-methyltransferase/precorrin-2 dehydrogenase/sirohydrochlorin ferrochelatase
MKEYPVFLRLAGQKVVVVGGGPVAASKLTGLLDAGAHVTVVAPRFVPEIGRTGVDIVAREFHPHDLDGARFVIAAATPEVNRVVGVAAAARNLFVNAADDVASATAYLGGVVRRGEVTVAISTGGAAPALAGLLREALDALLPRELDQWIELARKVRRQWKRDRIAMQARRPLLLAQLVALYSTREAA